MSEQVLVVDDEPAVRRILRTVLEEAGYRVVAASTGEEGVRLAELTNPDLMVLDLGLPGMSGLDVCRSIRSHSPVPILILSLRTAEKDKVAALDLGADDYVTKPFGIDELLARVRALLRRGRGESSTADPLKVGPLTVDCHRKSVTLGGERVSLTRTELDLLCCLAQHPGRVLTHAMIMHRVWGRATDQDLQSLRFHVTQVRKKIETDPAHPRLIITEIGIGYRFAEPDPADAT
jgi:two-component system KDP operon response regulator KdpE